MNHSHHGAAQYDQQPLPALSGLSFYSAYKGDVRQDKAYDTSATSDHIHADTMNLAACHSASFLPSFLPFLLSHDNYNTDHLWLCCRNPVVHMVV
jgi:hypothetical protein